MKHKEEDVPLASDGGLRDQTKAKFDQVLKMAVAQSQNSETKSLKKKKKTKVTDPVLENLRNGIGLLKDEEDQAIINNTYDPDDVKGEKSNKRRERQMKENRSNLASRGIENEGFEGENVSSKPLKKKKKKTKTIDHEEINSNQEANAPEPEVNGDELNGKPDVTTWGILDYADEARPQEEKKTKKKKKKKPPTQDIEMTERQPLSDEGRNQDEHEHLDATTREYAEHLDETSEQPEKTKIKKKKIRKKRAQTHEEEEQLLDCRPAVEGEGAVGGPGTPEPIMDDGHVLGVTIHRTDKLKTDFFVAQPSVRVHIMDIETGCYIKKLDKAKAVTAYYERENENVDFILPIMTLPFDFKKRKSTLPVWEELLLFNENIHYLARSDTKVILLFELLDMYSMKRAGMQYATSQKDSGFHHIAWGFLKMCSANGVPNTDKKVRLQLFVPPDNVRAKPDEVLVYQYWKTGKRIPYSSTLYVTAKGIMLPDKISPNTRSMFALQEEKGKTNLDDLHRTSGQRAGREDGPSRRNPSMWNRLAGQVCKIPNCLMLCLPSGTKGCFMMKFSYDGLSLACACSDKDGYPIIVYEIPSGRVKTRFLGHYGIVYDLDWTKNDKMLSSASSDGTARIWNMETLSNTPEKVMPHPSFVYAAKFHVKINRVVVTAGYDRIIRVWTLQGDTNVAQLMQELDGHLSHVNTLCFDTDGAKMYSADSLGVLRIWNVYVTDQPSKRGILREWSLNKEHQDEELNNVAINSIKIHPNGKRLLIHSRDNTLRTVDLRVLSVSQRYIGALNFREQIMSTITPCGSFVLSGSEDGAAYMWNFETGDQIARYAELNYHHPLTGVDFHPHDNMVAFCSFGENEPVLIYRYNHHVAQVDAGLEVEPDNMKRTGQPGHPDLYLNATSAKKQASDLIDGTYSKTEELNALQSIRMDRVATKLKSVLAFQTLPTPRANEHPMGVPSQATSPVPPTAGMSTWGSTFDRSWMQQGASKPMVTPRQMVTQQQMRHSGSDWRPGFHSIGKRGTLRGSGITEMKLDVSMDGRPSFSVQEHTLKNTPPTKVVALYDYCAQRSDEISFAKDDIIYVTFKDNENWWLGRLENGQQGFFPVNYVAEPGSSENDNHEDYARVLSQEQEDVDEPDSHNSKVTAVLTKSGNLRFYSGTEDSDIETPSKRTPKKKKGLHGKESPQKHRSHKRIDSPESVA